MQPRISDSDTALMYRRQAAGVTAATMADEIGTTRNAVLGILLRYRKRHGLPLICPHRAVRRPGDQPPPPKPKAPAARASIPARLRPVIGIKAAVLPDRRIVISPVRHMDTTPRCEALMPDGTACGRSVLRDCACMGHLFLKDRTAPLRLMTARYTSRMRLIERLASMVPTETIQDSYGRRWTRRTPVAGLSADQVSGAVNSNVEAGECESTHLEKLAAHYGWQRVDADTYVQRNERRAA